MYQNWDFLFEKKQSGNPARQRVDNARLINIGRPAATFFLKKQGIDI
jgi:hypothetical protein